MPDVTGDHSFIRSYLSKYWQYKELSVVLKLDKIQRTTKVVSVSRNCRGFDTNY